MARQRPTRLVMGPCIAEIDCIVIREVHHQLEVIWCRNEEVIVKGNFGWGWQARPSILLDNVCRTCLSVEPWLVTVPCIVEIDHIVIREVQYQFEVNRCRKEEIIVWSMWAGPQVEIDRIVIREVQYQFEVNRCRNEEIIVKGNFGWVWSMWAGRPRIDCIVIREVQYQFEVNRCRNEEIIVKAILGGCGLVMGPCIVEIDPNVITKVQYQFEVNPLNGNFWWVWPMWAGHPRIDRIVIREVQYQFEVNRCRNKEVNFQGSSAFCVGGDSGQDGRTDRRTAEITTISPPFFQKAWG
ncbi:hypothetical protein DPMN_047090 [Dreissena polymorpha]|uniref:Uncharacterized protein n=1 Tax=Dreissena polymorpha TaxID=45954 RepID=A0A9D4D927_DREPO|nr:hypothetical protein DPMN_047090 [Dreissena polymorpha]